MTKVRDTVVAKLGSQTDLARQGVYTHKRPLCVDGGSVSLLAARLTAPTSGPRHPGGGGVQADALAGPEDTTLRVRPESARRCRI